MSGFSRPYSDETINASPEPPVDDHSGRQTTEKKVPLRSLPHLKSTENRQAAQTQPFPVNLLLDRGLLRDLLLTLAAALLAGLTASGLFILLVFYL